ncbi:ANTAR domain-containing protein [Streptomyces sp. NPDC101209]|uniref:ANTAR domain-containing protein n=1 Tax=Streptomyces sp. NPDC101209 TaxID=3366129 RepID=UPI0037FA078E
MRGMRLLLGSLELVMPSSHPSVPPAEESANDKIARLMEENAQLRQAVDSHAQVDQAIGVLTAVWRVPPTSGWNLLREVSQHCNIKLHTVAEEIVAWALGDTLPPKIRDRLHAALRQWRQDPP